MPQQRPRPLVLTGAARDAFQQMSLVASCVMGASGLGYSGMGLCMLIPRLGEKVKAMPCQLLFKRHPESVPEPCEEGAGKPEQDGEGLVRGGLAYRLLAYLVLLLGVCRLAAALSWSCGYVFLGLVTCIGEMAFVGHELLVHESVLLNRAMALLSVLVVLSLIYIGTVIPHCRV